MEFTAYLLRVRAAQHGAPSAARSPRNMRCAVINSASQARPRSQAKMTSVSQWWPRKIG